jgi:O-antigen/teichoic acid export membrane protein
MSLKKNFGWAFAGNFINAGCRWGMLVAITKLCSIDDVGIFGLAMAISTPVIMFTNLHLRTVYATDISQQYRFGEYLGLRLLSVVIGLALVSFIAYLSGYTISTAFLVVLWCLAQCIVSVKDTYMGVMQKCERMDRVSMSRSLQSVFSLISFAIMLFWGCGLLAAVISVILVRITVLLFYDIVVAAKLSRENTQTAPSSLLPEFHWGAIFRLLWMTIPLGIVMGLTSLVSNIPRYFIEHHHGLQQLGYFTPLVSFIVVGNMAIIALAQSAAPRLAKYYQEDIRGFGRLLIKLGSIGLGIGVCGVLVAVLFGPMVLSVFFTPEYAQYNNVLIILMLSAVPYYISSFLNDGLLVARRIKVQLPLNCASVAAVAVASWMIVPKYGQVGAAWSIFAGSTVIMLGTAWMNIVSYRHRKKEILIELG